LNLEVTMYSEQEHTEERLEASDIESLKSALEEEEAKAKKYLSSWQRAEADFDNYKKRVEQERSENTKFANMALVINLLPVVDDFERALRSLPPTLAGLSWVDGLRLIHRKLQATLETQGLTEIKSVGETFDPAVHEAVTQAEGEEGKIIEELQKGYKLHDRVIRPALVVVGKGGGGREEEPGETED
jgi:molecular chaperone GrpE